MSTLLNELIEGMNPENALVTLEGRLAAHKFEIGQMSYTDLNNYKKQCSITRKGETTIDVQKLNLLIVVNHVKNPNFKSEEYVNAAGAQTATEAVEKLLRLGEIGNLANAIMEHSGVNDGYSIEAKENRIKN